MLLCGLAALWSNLLMSGSTMKPRALRSLLDAVLRTDSDLNAFCLDYFPVTYRQFAAGMDRSAKYTLLLDKNDAPDVLNALRDAYPIEVGKNSHLLSDGGSGAASGSAGVGPAQTPARTYERHELYDALCKLLQSQFDSILFRLNVPMAHTAPGQVPLASRAAELVRLLEQEGPQGLLRLAAAIKQVAPLTLP